MTEAADRGAVAVDGVELNMVLAREGRDIVEEGAGVDAWIRLQVAEDNHRLAAAVGV